jgi:Vitamin K-dependent gamma-carboxylase
VTADILFAGETSLAAARVALAVWLILVSAHWIASAGVFGPDGAVSWARMPGKGVLGAVRSRTSVRMLRVWMAGQLAIAVALLFAGSLTLVSACLLAALVSHCCFMVLTRGEGTSGADKMGVIVLAGTLIGAISLERNDIDLLLAACLISGGQLLICYHVAGVSKLLQPTWRSGGELKGVMAHPVWGVPWAAAMVRSRTVALLASWTLMLGEALFPLALFLPEPWLYAALGAMFVFHLATALIMRLSMFPWAFAAAYPSVLLLGKMVRNGFL